MMQQQEFQLSNDRMNTLTTDMDYLLAAYQAMPASRRRGSFEDYLKNPIKRKALQLHANAIRERLAHG